MRLSVMAALLLSIVPAGSLPAHAAHQTGNYPRLAQLTCDVGVMSEAEFDTLSRYDLLVLQERPEGVALLRAKNPDILLYFGWMPQNIVDWQENETFWYPDTSWSLSRLCQYYAHRNDWYLKTTTGERIPEWAGHAANWTRHCPRGVYGTARGKTYVEWLTEVAIPQITEGGGSGWEPWHEGTSQAYDGIMFEVLVDCVGSWGWQLYEFADPDQDGEAEGVYASCSVGGDDDPLTLLYREQNAIFRHAVHRLQDNGVSIILNAGNVHMGPSWRTEVSAVKLEAWMSGYSPSWQDWWDHFYGLQDYSDQVMWGPGYRWAESFVGYTGDDAHEGWDRSIVHLWPTGSWDESKTRRMKRWGLGTTLLGDGYFCMDAHRCSPYWQPEYEWDLGQPIEDFRKEVLQTGQPPDTLYVRRFTKGFVEVNPHDHWTGGVQGRDARFGFWQTVTNLEAATEDTGRIAITFTGPPQELCPVWAAEFRHATFPITPENWHLATPYAGGDLHPTQNQNVRLEVTGLEHDTMYYFALRNRVFGRLEPGTSNIAHAPTADYPSNEPPTDGKETAQQDWYPGDERSWGIGGPSFAPDGPAAEWRVSLEGPGGSAAIRVEVLDGGQNRIADLFDGAMQDGSTLEPTWDLRMAGGVAAPPGFYFLLVEVDGTRSLRGFFYAG